MSVKYLVSLCALLVLPWSVQPVFAHGPVARVPAVWTQQARLFIADAQNGEMVVIDLPEGNTVTRVPTPPFIMVTGFSSDARYLVAMRGRSTDRDWVTVIRTGFDPATGETRFPYVARTFLGSAPGGARHGHLASIGGKDAIFMEDQAEIQVYDDVGLANMDATQLRTYKLAAPDHYFYLEAADKLYVGHLGKGIIQVLNRDSGEEVARIPGCPVLHGMAKDQSSNRLFYACQGNVIVIGTEGDEADREVARIAYPGRQRVGAFLRGKDQVLWGYTEGELTALYRLDVARQPYAFEVLPLKASIQQNVNSDGSLLLVLLRSGVFEIRDGGDGELLHSVAVAKAFAAEFHEHVDKAILPDIQTLGDLAYVSLPHEGRIAEVNLRTAKVLRYLETGGEPSRLRLLQVTAGSD